MSTTAIVAPTERQQELLGQTVVVIGGSSGIGLETARRARSEGAEVIVTGRDPDRLRQAAQDLGALDSAAFDAFDSAAMDRFLQGLPNPIDHLMVTAGRPYYGRLRDMDLTQAVQHVDQLLTLVLRVARESTDRIGPGGSLVFISGTGARRPGVGLTIPSTITAALPALTANLALELAPVRVNLVAPGFVDTPLSASLLGGELEKRRQQLRDTLPIGRVVGPSDVAALAVHLMTNTALTGATYDIDGGQQLIRR